MRFDSNGDGLIVEAEFLKDPFIEFDPSEVAERQRMFRQGLDADQVSKDIGLWISVIWYTMSINIYTILKCFKACAITFLRVHSVFSPRST